MRVKSDARREAILETAKALFLEVGYERASMAMISARVGGSKATLYSYFQSKEDLFAAAILGAMEEKGMAVMGLLDPSVPDVRQVLLRFGRGYLELLANAEALAIIRTAVAEGSSSGLGAELYASGPRRGWLEVTKYLKGVLERGNLQPCDPHVAAGHLKGMLEAGVFEPLLFGAPIEVAIEPAVEAAVDAFMRAYGKATPSA